MQQGAKNHDDSGENFKCPICLDIMTEPVGLISKVKNRKNSEVKNGTEMHHFCKTCIEKHLTNSNLCPITRGEVINRDNLPINRELKARSNNFKKDKEQKEKAELAKNLALKNKGLIHLPQSMFTSARMGKPLVKPILLADGSTCNREDVKHGEPNIKNELVERILRQEKSDDGYWVNVEWLQNTEGEFFKEPVVGLHGNGGTVEERLLKAKEIKNYYPNKIIKNVISFAKQQITVKQPQSIDDNLCEIKINRNENEIKEPLLGPRQELGEGGDVLVPPEAERLNLNPGQIQEREGQNADVQARRCRVGEVISNVTLATFITSALVGMGLLIFRDFHELPDSDGPKPTPQLPTYFPKIKPDVGTVGINFQNPNQQDLSIKAIQIISDTEITDVISRWLPEDVQVESVLNPDQTSYTTTITPGSPVQLSLSDQGFDFLATKGKGPLDWMNMDPKTVSADIGSGLQPLEIQGKTNYPDPTPNIDSVGIIPQAELGSATYNFKFDLNTLPAKLNTIESAAIPFDSEGHIVRPDGNIDNLASLIVKISCLKKQNPELKLQLPFVGASPEACQQVLNNKKASDDLATTIAGAVKQTNADNVRLGCELTETNAEQMAELLQNIKQNTPPGTKVKISTPAETKDVKAISKQLCVVEPYVDEFMVQPFKPSNTTVMDYSQPNNKSPESPSTECFTETLKTYNDISCLNGQKINVMLTTGCDAAHVNTLGGTDGIWQNVTSREVREGSFDYRCVTYNGAYLECADATVPPMDLRCVSSVSNPTAKYSVQEVCYSPNQFNLVMVCEDAISIATKMKSAQEILGHKLRGYTFDNIVRDVTVTDDNSLANAAYNSQSQNSTFHSQNTNGSENSSDSQNTSSSENTSHSQQVHSTFNPPTEPAATGFSFTDLFNLAIEKIYNYFPENLRNEMYNAAKQGAFCGFLTALTDKHLPTYLSSQINPVTKQVYTKEEIFWLSQYVKALEIFLVTFNPIASLILPASSSLFCIKFDFETSSKYASYTGMLISVLTLNPYVFALGIAGCGVGGFIGNHLVSGGRKAIELGSSAYVATTQLAKSCVNKTYQVAGCMQHGFFAVKDKAAGFVQYLNPFAQKAVPKVTNSPVCTV